jgi:phosphopantetheinyl transferase (holo-ACP synthase)
MKHNTTTVTSFLEIVPLRGVNRSMCETMQRNFSLKEIAGLGDVPLQSIAGMIALKKALAKMALAAGGVRVNRNKIVLSHKKNGAPRLVSMPKCPGMRGKPLLSVSHTKTHAYGFAVLSQIRKSRAG